MSVLELAWHDDDGHDDEQDDEDDWSDEVGPDVDGIVVARAERLCDVWTAVVVDPVTTLYELVILNKLRRFFIRTDKCAFDLFNKVINRNFRIFGSFRCCGLHLLAGTTDRILCSLCFRRHILSTGLQGFLREMSSVSGRWLNLCRCSTQNFSCSCSRFFCFHLHYVDFRDQTRLDRVD
jgi:hypothetical protein